MTLNIEYFMVTILFLHSTSSESRNLNAIKIYKCFVFNFAIIKTVD